MVLLMCCKFRHRLQKDRIELATPCYLIKCIINTRRDELSFTCESLVDY